VQVKRAAVERVAAEFSAGSEITLEPGSGGHIHDTWFVTTRYDDFVLQRLNVGVFVDCVRMMENVLRVLSHLRSRVRKRRLPEPDRRVLTPVRARGGGALVFDEEGTPWRAFRRVERALSYEVGTSPAITFQIGRAFGQFFDDVQDLPGGPLPEAIVGFKDFVRRRRDFELVADADPYDRARSSKAEIEAVRHHHRLVDDLVSLRKRGLLRQRTVHNDARVNNVLLDAVTGEALCVIDLDTVGTGTVLYDFGDLLRSATVTAAEDDGDQPDLAVRDDLLQAAVRGYLREAGLLLTVDELSLLPLAGPLMAYENALRFLTDHLVGDVYYRISHPGQNLARCRTQLRVLDALTEAQGRVAELVRAAV
jgi:aminoglycoside phosphotransferase (APT) family kinase protein